VTGRLVDDSTDTGNVLHSLLEKYEFHRSNVFVVILHFLLKSFIELSVVFNSSVRSFMTLASIDKRGEN
jgi:hypothetical protein